MELVMDYKIMLVNNYLRMCVVGKATVHAHQSFFYKSGIIDRASDTKPKNHQNLWGKPLLKKFDDETQKKVRVQT